MGSGVPESITVSSILCLFQIWPNYGPSLELINSLDKDMSSWDYVSVLLSDESNGPVMN